MIAQEPRAWEGLDPEGVHKMRVATRRLRSALRAFKKVLPASIRSFNGEFKWLAAALGGVRDLDVARGNLPHFLSEIPSEDAAHLDDYQQYLADRWREERRHLLAGMASRRYGRLKAGFAQRLERGPSARVHGDPWVRSRSARPPNCSSVKRYRGVLRRGREITSASSDESLHALRIRCKRLRYLLEFFRPAYGELLKAETTRLKELQDVLGEFQDACVAGQSASPLRRRPTRAQRQPRPAQRAGSADRRPGPPGCNTPGRLRSRVGTVRLPGWSERDSSLAWRRVLTSEVVAVSGLSACFVAAAGGAAPGSSAAE